MLIQDSVNLQDFWIFPYIKTILPQITACTALHAKKRFKFYKPFLRSLVNNLDDIVSFPLAGSRRLHLQSLKLSKRHTTVKPRGARLRSKFWYTVSDFVCRSLVVLYSMVWLSQNFWYRSVFCATADTVVFKYCLGNKIPKYNQKQKMLAHTAQVENKEIANTCHHATVPLYEFARKKPSNTEILS